MDSLKVFVDISPVADGYIVEEESPAELAAAGRHYQRLWEEQNASQIMNKCGTKMGHQ